MKNLFAAVCGIAALALGGCASKPVLEPGQTAQIVEVTVTNGEDDLPTTDNFLEDLIQRHQSLDVAVFIHHKADAALDLSEVKQLRG